MKLGKQTIIMNRLSNFLAGIFFLLITSLPSISAANTEITTYFDQKLSKINKFLSDNHQEALEKPTVLAHFVDKELLKVWAAENTVRAMLGPKRWKRLTESQTNILIKTYENTIRRYLFEVLQQYRGQKASVESVRLNDKGNKGWLRVRLESSSFPTLNIDLKIYKEQEHWTVYDFSFQGISFVKMKRDFFRDTFDKSGAEGVVAELREKNKEINQAMAVASDE
ncbi:MlaC/ttg2D family ABC transporter substrate-binding protein [Kangiella geojedonensis]|uniref:Toluene tolerance family protein n=1 Tax=Kangiella geojedonensis TaxID=914150 RepID=A0A0F6TRC2_9GAMM|nr:ABC transporter substrate-binding protein [Kangiella geojedonensis]AKE52360.1 Toluene tolerance family protein [Kangiella geojedonensis]